MKKVIFAVVAFMFSLSAFAADTVKGVGLNGQEVVGTKHIFAVKHVGGVLHYRSSIGAGNAMTLSDANGSQHTKVLASFGAGNSLMAFNGWVYDLGKIKSRCYNPQTTIVEIDGVNNADFLADNCAFATAANNQ
jgi:hypothetical protein